MNRILQIILGLIFIQHLFALLVLVTFLPARIINFSKQMSKEFKYPPGQLMFESSLTIGPLKLSHTMEYDSVLGKGVRNFYASLPHLAPKMTIQGIPVIYNLDGQQLQARYAKHQYLEVPISQSRFRLILTVSFIVILLYLSVLLYVMLELFRFSKQAGKQEFFNPGNQRRLKIFGGFMFLTGLSTYITGSSGAWLLQQLTGTTGYIYDSKTWGGISAFPVALVAGLLMFIIANAFGKGQHLQKEQDLTI